jgi:hypothetical protein
MSATLTSLNLSTNFSATMNNTDLFPSNGFSASAGPSIPNQIFSAVNISAVGGSGIIQKAAVGQTTIAAINSSTTFDLSMGLVGGITLSDPLGNALTFTEVGAFIIYNGNPITSNITLTVYPAASHGVAWAQLAGSQGITPGNYGYVLDANALMPVGASASLLQVSVNTGSAVPFGYMILGK